MPRADSGWRIHSVTGRVYRGAGARFDQAFRSDAPDVSGTIAPDPGETPSRPLCAASSAMVCAFSLCRF